MTSVRLDHPDPSPGRVRQVIPRRRERPAGRPALWIGAVAVCFAALQLVLVVPGTGLGWDETVYVSQFSPQAPAAFFSAPRARGITYLVAPVTLLTTSLTALRVYLALLSAVGLFLALWVWRLLLPAPVVALAGGLLASLWFTVFYGPQVMPNLWVAYGALAATGCCLRALRGRDPDRDRTDRGALAGLGAAVAFTALMRPPDAAWLALPLALWTLAALAGQVRRARGLRSLCGSGRGPAALPVLAVLSAGAAVGAAPWVVEAYLHYGGLTARLDRGAEIQGGMGWALGFDDQLRALEGRALCRPCDDVPWRYPVTALWWFALPLFAVGGLVAARGRQAAAAGIALVTGLFLAVPYLLMLDSAAPRFLLPTYALLALPVALALHRLVTRARGRLRAVVVLVLAVCLGGHLAVQYAVLERSLERTRAARDATVALAAELGRQGVRPPCAVSGWEAQRVAFQAGCASRQTGGADGSLTRSALVELARTQPVAVLVREGRAVPSHVRGWREIRPTGLGGFDGMRVYLSPGVTP